MTRISTLLSLAARHPALTATVGGGAIVANQLDDRAKKLEAEIMRNRLGAPGGKFVYSELDKFASRKKFLAEKTAFEEPDSFNPVSSLVRGAGSETAKQIIQGVAGGVGRAARKVKDKVVQEPKRKKILRELVVDDPVVSMYEEENPGSAERAYSSMRRFDPEMSTDPNVVAAYLIEAAQKGVATN